MNSIVFELYYNKNIYRTVSGLGAGDKKNQWANKCLVCKIYKILLRFWNLHIPFYLLLPLWSKELLYRPVDLNPGCTFWKSPRELSENIMLWPHPWPIKSESLVSFPKALASYFIKNSQVIPMCCQDRNLKVDQDLGSTGS